MTDWCLNVVRAPIFLYPRRPCRLRSQVALIVLMAHMGCFVPASFCSLPGYNHIFSRIGNEDSMENNASTFLVEASYR